MAYYPANVMPVPNDLRPQPVDRKLAMAEAARLETPLEATARKAAGEPILPQYIPTPPNPDGSILAETEPALYGGGAEKKPAAG